LTPPKEVNWKNDFLIRDHLREGGVSIYFREWPKDDWG